MINLQSLAFPSTLDKGQQSGEEQLINKWDEQERGGSANS